MRDFAKGLSNVKLKEYLIEHCYEDMCGKRDVEKVFEMIEGYFKKRKFSDSLKDDSEKDLMPIKNEFYRKSGRYDGKGNGRNQGWKKINKTYESKYENKEYVRELLKLTNNYNVRTDGSLKTDMRDVPSFLKSKSWFNIKNYVGDKYEYFELKKKAAENMRRNKEERPRN